MEKIKGKTVKECILTLNEEELKNLSYKIGSNIGYIHNKNIIHGDITSSNILLDENGEIIFIDFGLSYYSDLFEDKAVDLLVFKKSLKNIHENISNNIFNWSLNGYVNVSKNLTKNELKSKIEDIESRGRYTH